MLIFCTTWRLPQPRTFTISLHTSCHCRHCSIHLHTLLCTCLHLSGCAKVVPATLAPMLILIGSKACPKSGFALCGLGSAACLLVVCLDNLFFNQSSSSKITVKPSLLRTLGIEPNRTLSLLSYFSTLNLSFRLFFRSVIEERWQHHYPKCIPSSAQAKHLK